VLDAVREKGYAQGHEIRTRKADGSELWSLVSFQQMVFEGHSALIGGLHDITQRKLAAEETERARAAAEAANRTKSVFLANLTHEVRTPIMAMLGAAEASTTQRLNGGGQVDHARIISRNGRHLLALFENLLDLACLDAGKFTTRSDRCSLVELLADVHAVAHALREGREVDFRIVCESELPAFVRTDPIRLKQALINLIGNALKFTTSGHVHVRVRVHAEAEEPRLTIAVQDTGPGLAADELQRIFDPFEQVEPRPGEPLTGVGLGLPLARRIAEELGGTVEVESRLGAGSTFTLHAATGPLDHVEWLAADAVEAALTSPDEQRHDRQLPRIDGSVLLAEDTEDTRTLVAAALESAGAKVTVATNGREALDAASTRVFDLVLMDIRMPVMDGRTAMAGLRAVGYLAPIIALTASDGKDDHQQLLDSGFDDVWPKPISLERIIERAGDYLRTPRPEAPGGVPPVEERAPAPSLELRLASARADFARGLPRRMRTLESAVRRGDVSAAREVLHQLAGTAGVMDFMPLSEEAGRALREVKRTQHLDAEELLRPLQSLVDDIADGNGGQN